MARGSSSTMERERDERGRFVSDDDDDRDYRRRSSSRSRYDDDDRRHSMAARDEEGRFTMSRSRYDQDDDRHFSRSRYDDEDDNRRSRGHGGWVGDPEGHSEASRRGWGERGGSRSNYRDDDRRRSMPARGDEGRFTSSRSRYDDDDRRSSRSRYSEEDDDRVVVAGMAVGTAIQRATPRRHGAGGMSAAVRMAAIATMMTIAGTICLRGTTKAGLQARGPRATMTTMTIGAAAADTAAGTAIRKVTPKPRAAVEGRLRPTEAKASRRSGPWRPFAVAHRGTNSRRELFY